MSEIAAAIAAVKHAIDIGKFLADGTTSLKEAEQKLKLADLISALAEAKIQLATVQDTLIDQRREIRDLQQQQAFAGTLEFQGHSYWRVVSGKRGGPFCQNCWDKDEKAIRLYEYSRGWWQCHTCDARYADNNTSGIGRAIRSDDEDSF